MNTYGIMIHPISDQCMWQEVDVPIIAPPLKGRPSRLKLWRKKKQSEKPEEVRSRSVGWTICKKARHNKRTCSGGAKQSRKKVCSMFLKIQIYLIYGAFFIIVFCFYFLVYYCFSLFFCSCL
ncbi:hypothetical protein ACOSQ4_004594 [Xanthoceras sorbifolium]